MPTYGWVMAMSVVWSQGLHLWMPLPNSMALALAEPGQGGAPSRPGGGRRGPSDRPSASRSPSRSTLLGVKIRPLYLVAGAAALVAALACLGIPRVIRTPKQKLVFRAGTAPTTC